MAPAVDAGLHGHPRAPCRSFRVTQGESEMIRLLGAALLFARLIAAQGIDSFKLIDNPTARIAVDSQGNLATVQLTANAWVVHRYDSHGLVAQTLNGPNQVVSATNAFATVLALDSSDNIYLAGETIDGKAILLRPSDPPGQAPWTPSISGAPLGIVGMAFDPQGNPVVLADDSRGGPSQLLKIHRGSGEILAVYTLNSSNPMALATDRAGAVYVSGGTTSAQFPVTSGAGPAYCLLDPVHGYYNCSQAFVTKLDSGLQRVVYSSLLTEGWAVSLAVAPNGGVYAGIQSGVVANSPPPPLGSVFSLDSQGLVVASSTAVPGPVKDLHVDSSGNVIALGETPSGSLCGPDRPNLGLLAVFVTRFDSHLAGVSSSAVIPQQAFLGGGRDTAGRRRAIRAGLVDGARLLGRLLPGRTHPACEPRRASLERGLRRQRSQLFRPDACCARPASDLLRERPQLPPRRGLRLHPATSLRSAGPGGDHRWSGGPAALSIAHPDQCDRPLRHPGGRSAVRRDPSRRQRRLYVDPGERPAQRHATAAVPHRWRVPASGQRRQ